MPPNAEHFAFIEPFRCQDHSDVASPSGIRAAWPDCIDHWRLTMKPHFSATRVARACSPWRLVAGMAAPSLAAPMHAAEPAALPPQHRTWRPNASSGTDVMGRQLGRRQLARQRLAMAAATGTATTGEAATGTPVTGAATTGVAITAMARRLTIDLGLWPRVLRVAAQARLVRPGLRLVRPTVLCAARAVLSRQTATRRRACRLVLQPVSVVSRLGQHVPALQRSAAAVLVAL